jgi:hypothetical protein
MTSYSASDFCQGHGGGRDCPYDSEIGCGVHANDDCGVVSYCDGSCASALEAWQDQLTRTPSLLPAADADRITLDVSGYGEVSACYRVVFEGPDASAWALAYMRARPRHHFAEAIDAPNQWADRSQELVELLYPTCHHGLDLHLCMDPFGEEHFGTREQELANGW